MTETIIIALITALASIIPSIISIFINNKVIETKVEALAEEVKKHNNFAQKIPVLEEKISQLEKAVNK